MTVDENNMILLTAAVARARVLGVLIEFCLTTTLRPFLILSFMLCDTICVPSLDNFTANGGG